MYACLASYIPTEAADNIFSQAFVMAKSVLSIDKEVLFMD
jgi:hypothetical protein